MVNGLQDFYDNAWRYSHGEQWCWMSFGSTPVAHILLLRHVFGPFCVKNISQKKTKQVDFSR